MKLATFNRPGQKVVTLVDGWREAGTHEVIVDGSSMPSGMYLYRLKASGSGTNPTTVSGKMVQVK